MTKGAVTRANYCTVLHAALMMMTYMQYMQPKGCGLDES